MRYLLTLIVISGLFGCKSKTSDFSEAEAKLMDSIGFERGALIKLKQYVKVDFNQFETSDPGVVIGSDGTQNKTGIKKQNGISFQFPEDRSDDVVLRFKDELRQKGFLIFLSERGYESPSTISILKTTDYLDILRIQMTDGINYDLENKDIIEKLKGWHERYGIEVLGADYDWVDLIFMKTVEDVPQFAKEVYEFCPDAVDQGVGDIKVLEKIISDEKRLFLWWD